MHQEIQKRCAEVSVSHEMFAHMQPLFPVGHTGCICLWNDIGVQKNFKKDKNVYFLDIFGDYFGLHESAEQGQHCSKTPRVQNKGSKTSGGKDWWQICPTELWSLRSAPCRVLEPLFLWLTDPFPPTALLRHPHQALTVQYGDFSLKIDFNEQV